MRMHGDILTVSQDPGEKRLLKGLLNIESLKLLECSGYNEALEKVKQDNVSMVVISPLGNRVQGLKLKRNIQLLRPEVEVVLLDNFRNIRTSEDLLRRGASDYIVFLSSHADTEKRVEGLKLGAIDYITKPFDLEELSLKIDTLLKRDRRIREEMETARGITGRLEEMPLPDIVQFLNLGLKTAQVKILHESEGEEGVVYFSRGEITFATVPDLEGEEAFMRMLHWDQGRFTLRHGLHPQAVNISRGTMGLLMDGMKMIDEENRDRQSAEEVKAD